MSALAARTSGQVRTRIVCGVLVGVGWLSGGQVCGDLLELLEGGAEVFDDLVGDPVGGGRLAESSMLSSRSQKMSRLTLSRLTRSS